MQNIVELAVIILITIVLPMFAIYILNSFQKRVSKEQSKMLDEFRKRKEEEIKNEMDKDIGDTDINSEFK